MIEEYIKIKETIENNEHEIKTSYILKNKTIRINLLLSTISSFCFHLYFIYNWFLSDNGILYYLFLAFAISLMFLQIIEAIMDEIEEIKDEKRKNIVTLIALNLLIPLSFVISPVYTLISIIFICTNSKYIKESEKRMKKLEYKTEKLKLRKIELWRNISEDKESLKIIENSKEIKSKVKKEYLALKEEKAKLILEKAFKEKELIVE